MTAFRGRVAAAGFILDTPLLGTTEAADRALTWWQEHAELSALPDGRWLLLLPSTVDVRAEHAPGLPVSGGEPGWVDYPAGGGRQRLRIADLPSVAVYDWLDLTGLPVEELTPLDRPAPTPATLGRPDTPDVPDLRAVAGVGAPTTGPGADRSRGRTGPAALVATAVRSLLSRRRAPADAPPTPAGQGRPSRPAAWRSWLARIAMRSPAAHLVRGRHARYLRRLTEAFEKRRWDDALREAIGVGAHAGEGFLDLRVPTRRAGAVTPSTGAPGPTGIVDYGPSVRSHLSDLYRQAATQLEAAGRIEEAAFVLADLLGHHLHAVGLLELHHRPRLAAELAEAHALAPDLVVRLWWRAGNRDRAVDVARLRGAFATTVHRLHDVDPEAARELRTAWVHSLRRSGDPLGAVEAAWPDPHLRPLVAEDIRAGVGLAGPVGAALLAYQLATAPAEAAPAVDALLAAPEQLPREHFAATLATLVVDDPVADRRIATATVRALARDAGQPGGPPVKTAQRVFRVLRDRADPVTAADLPVPSYPGQPRTDRPPHVTAAAHPGQSPLRDAAALPDGTILLAHGEAGARLVDPQGRVRSRWDVPCHQIVLADHGASALLVAHRDTVADVRILDLATRRLRYWATLRVSRIVDSYDGGHLLVTDADGIAVLDTTADGPRVVWRELQRDIPVLHLARTATSCAAALAIDGQTGYWRWDMPGWHLRIRPTLPDRSPDTVVNAAGFHLGTLNGTPHIAHGDVQRPAEIREPGDQPYALLANGDAHALALADADSDGATLHIGTGLSATATTLITFPAAAPEQIGMRAHDGTLTAWHPDGRVAVVTGARPTANFRTRAQ
ncbi:hypothetical protein AB0M43_02005 [Longispora sp. NPDC051575]|uniref:hypothetical protein n=1 Tax=Longispora sp. NPDC051575 TaxID=3154943 RepID=UPI0034274A0D